MSRGRIVILYGTRPEAIKLGPVAGELRSLGVEPTIVATGQHTTLLDGIPSKADLAGSCSLGLSSAGDVVEWVGRACSPIREALESVKPIAALVVQGDTMSAYAGALAASSVPVAHVEAGLRSHHILEPWPEEGIRKAITRYADWHYAPTDNARANLLSEGIPSERIHVTGNTSVSAIARYTDTVPCSATKQILVTMHRREWVGRGKEFVKATLEASYQIAQDFPDIRFLWPMHPNVVKVGDVDPTQTPKNVLISPPLSYVETVRQLARSMGVATDSGGLQEEAATLGVPCCVLRNVTDRPESIDAGTAELCPPTPAGIRDAIRRLALEKLPRIPLSVYGTPESAKRIAEHLRSLT